MSISHTNSESVPVPTSFLVVFAGSLLGSISAAFLLLHMVLGVEMVLGVDVSLVALVLGTPAVIMVLIGCIIAK